jgi:hypothetical protein
MPEHTAVALAIGGGAALMHVLLAALLITAIWLLVSVYAIVKWVGSAPEGPNPYVVVLGVAGLVALFTLLIGVALGLIGRPMSPRKGDPR